MSPIQSQEWKCSAVAGSLGPRALTEGSKALLPAHRLLLALQRPERDISVGLPQL